MCAFSSRNEQPGSQSTLPLGNLPIADTTRAEEAENYLSRELSRLRIVSVTDRNRFRLHMNGVRLGEVFLGFNRFDVHTMVDPGRLEEAFIFSFGHERPSVLSVDGKSVVTTPSSAVMLPPECSLRIERPAGSGMFLIRTTPHALAHRFQSLAGRELQGPLQFTLEIDLSTEPCASALRLVRFVISEMESTGPYPMDPARNSALEGLLLSALLALPNNHSGYLAGDFRGQISPRLVRIAEEFMDAQSGQQVTISDLLAICGSTRSVLFEAFRRFRNHTPMEFLMDRRMQTARRLLQSAAHDSVTSVAQDCGFTHLGRFAVEYRARFGESPSQTLRANRQAR